MIINYTYCKKVIKSNGPIHGWGMCKVGEYKQFRDNVTLASLCGLWESEIKLKTHIEIWTFYYFIIIIIKD